MRARGIGEHRGPLVLSDDLAIELERPHVVQFDGLIYLFWSSPQYVFNPDVSAPTGLYGAVSEGIDGEFELLNSTGLVISNPAECPSQVYSWHVANDLTVQGFVDQVVVSEPEGSTVFVETRHRDFDFISMGIRQQSTQNCLWSSPDQTDTAPLHFETCSKVLGFPTRA